MEFFIACCNQKLLRELQSMQADGRLQEIASVRGRLAMALKLRLQMLEPVIESWPQVRVFVYVKCVMRAASSSQRLDTGLHTDHTLVLNLLKTHTARPPYGGGTGAVHRHPAA